MEPAYLGDGVYAQYDGSHVILTTGTHELECADNTIFLEDEVIAALERYFECLREELRG